MTWRLYPDVNKCRALIIDASPTSRSILAGMLREMGVVHVTQTSRVADARRLLENRTFDIVLCDYHFDNSLINGQTLLDDLRRAQLLPYSTVFVMVTGEASYAMVAEAAEAALDSYLLKPHSATSLEHRLLQARHRKKALHDIFVAIEANDFARAAQLCSDRFEQRAPYWLYAARIGAELNIRLSRHDDARRLYEAVQATRALPWARLGVARVEVERGQLREASRTLEALITDDPAYADAYDVMGRLQVEQGELTAALKTYRQASTLTPASISRLQKHGMLAFYAGTPAEAQGALERAARIGANSKMFDHQSLVLLAQLQFDAGDRKAFRRTHEQLAQAAQRRSDDPRLQRYLGVTEALCCLMDRQIGQCLGHVERLVDGADRPDFDFESATNLLSLLTRLQRTELQLPMASDWVRQSARRFCVSRAASELLRLSVQGCADFEAAVRAGHSEITQAAEQAMSHSVIGSPQATIQALLAKGGETLNAKLIDLAEAVMQRHAQRIDEHASLAERIAQLRQRHGTTGTRVGLGSAPGRAAGSVTIRG